MKKIIFSVLAGIALTAMTASTTLAYTQAEIDALIAQFVASLGGTTTTTTTTTTGGYVHAGVTQDFVQYIYFGSKGAEVSRLQIALAPYGAGSADGIYGTKTKAAVIAFQQATNIGVDGKVGPQTRGELNRKGEGSTTETTTGTSDVTGDKLVISAVASDDVVVGKDQKVIFAKLTLEAGDEDVTVKDILVDYTGSADNNTIDKVQILDSSKSEIDSDGIDSDDESKLDVDVDVDAGETVTLYLAATTDDTGNFTDADNGLDISLTIREVITDGADVEGTPLEGATHELHDGVDGETVTVSMTSEGDQDIAIGEEEVFAELELENDTTNEDIIINSIVLQRTAAEGDDDTFNFIRLKADGRSYKATEGDDEEYTFDLGGLELADDEDITFEVSAEAEEAATGDITFTVIEVNAETVEGVIVNPDSITESEGVSVEVSTVLIDENSDFEDAEAAAGTSDVVIAEFEVTVEGEDIMAEELELTVAAAGLGVDATLEKITLYDEDGNKIGEAEDDFEDGDTTIVFEDVEFKTNDGDEIKYVVKADINTDTINGGTYTVSDVVITGQDVETESGEDVDPTEITEGFSENQVTTVEGADLEVSVKDADETDVNDEMDDVVVAELEFDAEDSGDTMKVSEVILAVTGVKEVTTLTVAGTATGVGPLVVNLPGGLTESIALVSGETADETAETLAGEIVANHSDVFTVSRTGAVITLTNINNVDPANGAATGAVDAVSVAATTPTNGEVALIAEVENCELFDGDDSVSSREDASTSTKFSTDFEVEAGEKKTILVKCNIGELTNGDKFVFTGISFESEGDVTGTEVNGTVANTLIDSDTTVTIVEGVAHVTVEDDTAARSVKESEEFLLGVIEIEADNGDILIKEINAQVDSITAIKDGDVKAYFVTEDGDNWEKDGSDKDEQTLVNATDSTFDMGDEEVKDGEKVFVGFYAEAENVTASTDITLEVTNVILENGTTDITVVMGNTNNSEGSAESTDTFGEITVMETIPVVTQVNSSTDMAEGGSEVMNLISFNIKADGTEDAEFTAITVKITDETGVTILDGGKVELYRVGESTALAEATYDGSGSDDLDFLLLTESVDGSGETYEVRADVTSLDNGLIRSEILVGGITFTSGYVMEDSIVNTLSE